MAKQFEQGKDELAALEQYASAANNKVLSSQADLDPKDRAMQEMHAWCEKQGDIVVLNSGLILSSNPTSRAVQNCKIVMLNKGIKPGKVMPATSALITMLLANAESPEDPSIDSLSDVESVSVQQQRLRLLIREAVIAQASDIHIEVREDIAKIRFRKHGELYLHAEWLPRLGREIASVAFNKETDHAIAHFNPLVPQNASMPLTVDDIEVRLRLASLPAHGGFDMVMRILTTGHEKAPTLSQLGYTEEQINIISKAAQMPHGAVIVAGPTGSGKTTTLASCMQLIGPDRKIYTIEDPVEKLISNATQVPVNTEKEDRDFAWMGRAALRMDPDTMVLGEIRDEDTAQVMVRAAITGHLVFSTIHTNTAPGIVPRLVDMGISPILLGDPNLLVCLICQRLIPKLCEHCALPIEQSPQHQPHLLRWQALFGEHYSQLRARGGITCPHCKGLGIAGRTVVAEVIWVDEAGRHFIQKCDTLGWDNYLKEQGWSSYREHAINLVKQGICDPLDAEKIVGYMSNALAAANFNYRNLKIAS